MLSKKFRLTKNGSFQYVYRKGSAAGGPAMTLVYVPSSRVKIGFSVSNKIGHAVCRNKVKRRMRAAAAEFLRDMKPAQAVFNAKKGIDLLSYAEIRAQMIRLLEKARLINEKEKEKN